MGLIKTKKTDKQNARERAQLRSIMFQKEKVDRHGQAWKKADFWIRKDHLNKLKVVAHFQKVSVAELINKALGEFVTKEYDKSQALKRIVQESQPKPKVKV